MPDLTSSRSTFSNESLRELADSIRQDGVIHNPSKSPKAATAVT
ncbi:MAG: hypothetical protein R3C44_22145 [Chloroflexota bacterium]